LVIELVISTPGERVYVKSVSRVRIPLCPLQRTDLRVGVLLSFQRVEGAWCLFGALFWGKGRAHPSHARSTMRGDVICRFFAAYYWDTVSHLAGLIRCAAGGFGFRAGRLLAVLYCVSRRGLRELVH